MKSYIWRPLLDGMDVVCMASGPSLTDADIATVRQWRESGDDRRVIVTNTTYRSALWADALFAMDLPWWRLHHAEVASTFRGKLATSCNAARQYGIPHVRSDLRGFYPNGNSGAAAISLACNAGAARVILIGYDCQFDRGRKHHFGDHPRPLGNCASIANWQKHFESVRKAFPAAEIVNASRQSALGMFPRVSLEQALQAETA